MNQIDTQRIFEKLLQIEKEMITRNELNRILETIEVISNPQTMNQIISSEKDIILGNIREINSVKDI
jgi:antitoxin YefM